MLSERSTARSSRMLAKFGDADDLAVDRDHEDPLPKPGDVLEDAAQVGNFHRIGGRDETTIRPASKAENRRYKPVRA